jgi:hypothetical protein
MHTALSYQVPKVPNGIVYINNGAGVSEMRMDGSLSWRDNNPGNIEGGSFAFAHGAIGKNGRFAIFPNYTIRLNALNCSIEFAYLSKPDCLWRD